MANVFITEHPEPAIFQGNMAPVLDMPPLATQVVAIGGGSVQSAAFNAKTRLVDVHAGAICSVEFGANPTATANSRRMAAGESRAFRVQAGHKIAVITNT